MYLTTSDLGFQKSQKGVKDLAKTPAFTDMPFQEMDGPKGIRDELLQVSQCSDGVAIFANVDFGVGVRDPCVCSTPSRNPVDSALICILV